MILVHEYCLIRHGEVGTSTINTCIVLLGIRDYISLLLMNNTALLLRFTCVYTVCKILVYIINSTIPDTY